MSQSAFSRTTRTRSSVPCSRYAVLIGVFSAFGCASEFDSEPSASGGGGGQAASAGTAGAAAGQKGIAGAGGSAALLPAIEQTASVNQTFWHAGWKVTLTDAKLSVPAGAAEGEVALALTLENLGSSSDEFSSRLLLTAAGKDYQFSETYPEVPGGRSATYTATVDVPRAFELDLATLLVGSPENNQAIVPIGADSTDELLSLEPVKPHVSGEFSAGVVDFEVTAAELRADLLGAQDEVDEAHLALTLWFSATQRDALFDGADMFPEMFTLRLPNGNEIVADSAPNGNFDRVGSTFDDLSARFIVPRSIAGKYAFIAGGPWIDDPDEELASKLAHAEGELEFELERAPTLAE